MKAQDGTLLLNTEDNISRWVEYCMNSTTLRLLGLLSDNMPNTDLLNNGRDEPLTEWPLHEVTCEEVKRQTKQNEER